MLPVVACSVRRGTLLASWGSLARTVARTSHVHKNKEISSTAVLTRVKKFAEKEGRQPRILITKLGDGGNDATTMVVATGFADLGFDVDVGPWIHKPEEAALQAVDADVHAIGARVLAADYLTLVPALTKELAKLGRPDITIVVAGDIPKKDQEVLYQAGVADIFSSRAPITDCAMKTLDKIEAELDPKKQKERSI